jgi:hypothetical protein
MNYKNKQAEQVEETSCDVGKEGHRKSSWLVTDACQILTSISNIRYWYLEIYGILNIGNSLPQQRDTMWLQ